MSNSNIVRGVIGRTPRGREHRRGRSLPPVVGVMVACLLTPVLFVASADGAVVDAGALRAVVHEAPWSLSYADRSGSPIVTESNARSAGSRAGALGFSNAGAWFQATRAFGGHMQGSAYVATLQTEDPLGRTISVRVAPAGEGIVAVSAVGPVGSTQMGIGFTRKSGERFVGFGERSDAVTRTAGTVGNHVAEGPYQPLEEPLISAFVPLPGYDPRPDATYFPIPWLLSSRGYGVHLAGDQDSSFSLGRRWSATTSGRRLGYRVYAGPTPAAALARFTADVGRQPPAAAPFYFGPWWQPHGNPSANVKQLRDAGGGALGSLVQTYTHYLPCGAQQGRTSAEQAATRMFHGAGLAVTTYFNPMICTGYRARYEAAARGGLLTRNLLGLPYVYRYTGASTFLVGQLDFSARGATRFFGETLSEAVANGYDGWMEDFGEYTPPDSVSADGTPGTAMHNLYPTLYHGAAYDYSLRAPRPLARFNRSGWTGTARVSQLVWGGDPSTGWGFDGLRSAIYNGLTMGASGVSLWGSDIGGYFALSLPQTQPELLARWIEFGFASGVMRTQANGFSLGATRRAQIFDPEVLPVWTRYARLRTQLAPYLAAAERTYDHTGLPIMRQLMLAYPDDARSRVSDDEYLFGPDLLVAPVVSRGAQTQRVYLPPGRWIDFWRSVELGRDGAPRLKTPVVMEGGREVMVPAPLDQLPMFVRAGAAIGLLPADVQTLSSYGGGVVHLGDRAAKRSLVAWPVRGAPGATAALAGDGAARSLLDRSGAWKLRVRQRRTRTLDLQVALPSRPCRLLVNGRRVAFRYSQRVLRARVRLRNGTVASSRNECPRANKKRTTTAKQGYTRRVG